MPSCGTCGGAIRWVRTRTGAKLPLELEPDDERGNVIVMRGVAHVYADAVAASDASEANRYIAHFAVSPRCRPSAAATSNAAQAQRALQAFEAAAPRLTIEGGDV